MKVHSGVNLLYDPNHQNNTAFSAAKYMDCTDDYLEIWALEDLTLQYAGVVVHGARAKMFCHCLHSGPEKKSLILTWTDPNLDWSHLCHSIILSEPNVRHTKNTYFLHFHCLWCFSWALNGIKLSSLPTVWVENQRIRFFLYFHCYSQQVRECLLRCLH